MSYDASSENGDGTQLRPSPFSRAVDVLTQPLPTLALALLGLALVGFFFTQTLLGQQLDHRAMSSIGADGQAWAVIVDPLAYVTIASVGTLTLGCVIVALARRRFDLAIGVVAFVVGSNLTTQVLKHTISYTPAVAVPSLPSGHTTVAMSLSMAALFVVPAGARRLLLAGCGFLSTFIGAGTVVGHWHYPADVVAAFCVCLGWAALITAALARLSRGTPQRVVLPYEQDNPLTVPGLTLMGTAVAGLVMIIAGVRPSDPSVNLKVAALTLLALGLAGVGTLSWCETMLSRHLPEPLAQPELIRRNPRVLSVFVGAMGVLGVVATLRGTNLGRRVEVYGYFSLGGQSRMFQPFATFLPYLPHVTALTALVALAALIPRATRSRAALALGVIVVGNVAVQGIKSLLASTLFGNIATFPSGHAMLGLTAAVAWILLAPQRYRAQALAVSTFWASFATLGVLAGRMHVPGDTVASMALMCALIAVVWWFMSERVITVRAVPGLSLRDALTWGGYGLAVLLLTLTGWGLRPIRHDAFGLGFGLIEMLGIPVATLALLLWVERVATGSFPTKD